MLETLAFNQKTSSPINPVGRPIVGFNFDKEVSTGSTAIDTSNRSGQIVTPSKPITGYSKVFNLTSTISNITPVTSFDIGSGDFTFEMYFYLIQSTAGYNALFFQSNSAGNKGIYISIGDNGAYANRLRFSLGGTSGPFYTTSVTRSQMLNNWYHIALVRSGSSCFVYLNGVRQKLASGTSTSYTIDSIPITGNLGDTSNALSLGYSPLSFYPGGHIPEFALFSGVRYTKDFTPPSPIYTATGMNYSQFTTYMTTGNGKNIASLSNTSNGNSMQGKYTQAAIDNTGQLLMYGSSYGSNFTSDSLIQAILLHACPTQTVANEVIANKRISLFLVPVAKTQPSFPSVTRNGYTSRSYTQYTGCTLIDFVYYDASQGVMMRYNPSIADTPVPFDGNLKTL